MLEIYIFDTLILALYIYVFHLHMQFTYDENQGLGVTDVPKMELMYIEALSKHNGENQFNMHSYLGLIIVLSYAK